jgi:hypothetical protein
VALETPGGAAYNMCTRCFNVLKFDHPDWVAMQTRQAGLEVTGEIRLRELVKKSLRMRPSRMVGGQIWGSETSAPCRRVPWNGQWPAAEAEGDSARFPPVRIEPGI